MENRISNFYTDFFLRGSTLFVREVTDSGRRNSYKKKISPVLYVESPDSTTYKNIYGKNLEPIRFDTPKEAREFANTYKESDFEVYGFPFFEYTAINELYPGNEGVSFDMAKINVGYLDIETESEEGWPDIDLANERINAITLATEKKYHVLGLEDVDCNFPENAEYQFFKSEEELLKKFVEIWQHLDLDIVTGWNVDFFDITYIVNRLKRLFGEDFPKCLSPWRIINQKTVNIFNSDQTRYEIMGISVLDYLDLYKKFTQNAKESYKLDYIAQVELGEKKVEYDGSLKDLYTNDYPLYIKYNVKDVGLIISLEKKKRFIELACTIAYSAKIPLKDIFTTVRLWDVIISNYLYNERKEIVPFSTSFRSNESFEGGYVKSPITGKYDMVGSFDFTSLYPSLIITYNISPETILPKTEFEKLGIDDVVDNDQKMDCLRKTLLDKNASICSNGALYSKSKKGFLPELMERYFALRKKAKNEMKESKRIVNDIDEILKQRGHYDEE